MRAQGVSADSAAAQARSQILQAVNEARIADERSRDALRRLQVQVQETADFRLALATESAVAQSLMSEILALHGGLG